ncbi:MAG: 3-oxoacyl-ACP reductase FabG [Agathobaculum butyriciproducens]
MAQTVLITGGSRGIGAACVRTFAENGWNIAFTYSKSREAADRLAGETGALALLADQQDTAAVELAAAEVKARFGTIDAVVCNAGIAEQKLFQNITDADWMRMLDVNLMGTVRTIRAVLPEMLHNHKGSIVTVSSMWGECGASCESHYSASKAAIIGLSKSLAQELGPSNIRVNCIAPGVIDTDMNAMHSADTMQELADQTPLGRVGAAAEVADRILYLCSDQSSFITGQVLGVTGGCYEAVAKPRCGRQEERTVGRSKVVRKFPYGNFLPPKVKKSCAILARLLGRAAPIHAPAFLEFALQILLNAR